MAEVTSRMHALEVAAEAFRGGAAEEIVDAAERFAAYLDGQDSVVDAEIVDDRKFQAWVNERGLNARLAAEFAVDADPKGAVIGFLQAAGGSGVTRAEAVRAALNLLLAHSGVGDSERVKLCLQASCAERWTGDVVERLSGTDGEQKPWTRVELVGGGGGGPRKSATVTVVWGPEPF